MAKESLIKSNKSLKDKPLVPNWTPRNAKFVGAIGCVLAVGLGYIAVVQPVQAQKEEIAIALETAESSYEIAQQKLVEAQGFEKRYPIAKTEHDKLILDFPASAQIDAFKEQVETIARASGVTLDSLTSTQPTTLTVTPKVQPPPPVPEADAPGGELVNKGTGDETTAPVQDIAPAMPTLASSNITIMVKGDKASLARFATQIKDMQRSLIVMSISLSQDGDSSALTLQGTTFLHAPIADPMEKEETEQTPDDGATGDNSQTEPTE